MRCPRIIPFLKPGLALGAKRHAGFADAWNWLIHSFWHLKLGDGLKWKDKWYGYPEIHLAIEAGEGIDVKYEKGKVIISAGNGETHSDGSESGGGGVTPGEYDPIPAIVADDGQPGDGDTRQGGGGESGESGGGQSGSEDAGGGGNGTDTGGESGTSCNEFSDDDPENGMDMGLFNGGDDCALLNGW